MPRRLSPQEEEIQNYISRAQQGLAGQSPKAQTMARSRDPRTARAGQEMIADRAYDNTRNQVMLDRENERMAREQEAAAKQAAADAAKAARQQQARDVRSAAAQGIDTTTDIETGKTTIKRNPDGSPAWQTGPVGDPYRAPDTVKETTVTTPDGQTYRPLSNPLMPNLPDGALGATGGEKSVTENWQQDRRDAKGNVTQAPLPVTEQKDSATTPDTATGKQTVEIKDATGLPQKRLVGVDSTTQEQHQRIVAAQQKQAQLDISRNQIAQAKAIYGPQFEPIEKAYREAESKWKPFTEDGIQRKTLGKISRWVRVNEKGFESPLSDSEAAAYQRNKAQAKQNFDMAAKAYNEAKPRMDNIQAQADRLELARLNAIEEEQRAKHNLPIDEGFIARILGKADGVIDTTPEAKAAQEIEGQAAAAGQPTKPEVTPEAADAFKSLYRLDGVEIEPRNGWTALNRNGKWIASLENDNGNPIVTLKDGASEQDDISNIVRQTENGVPLYLRDNKNRMSIADEAAKVAEVYRTMGDKSLTDDQKSQALSGMSLDPLSIRRSVGDGVMSVQTAKSLLKNLWNDSLEPTDAGPKGFQEWLKNSTIAADRALSDKYGKPLTDKNAPGRVYQQATDRSGIPGVLVPGLQSTYSRSKQQQVGMDFARHWALTNAGKPGVTRKKIAELYDKAGVLTQDGITGKAASAINSIRDIMVNDVAGSMLGMGAGLVGDASSAEAAIFGSEEAKAMLKESMRLRNRDFANFALGTERTIKKLATAEGRQVSATLNSELDAFRKTMDEEANQPNPDTARIAAAELRVRNAALALHNLAPDENWPVTEKELDPNKDGSLGQALADYQTTGDPRSFALYRERLVMSNGRRQLSAEMAQKLGANRGGFLGSVAGAMNVGWQELAAEALADTLALATAGGSKAIQKGLKFAGAVGKAERVEAASARIGKALDSAWNAGIKTGTLAKPLTTLDKARNVAVRGTQAFAGEGMEGLVVSPGEDNPTPIQDFLMEGLGGVTLIPAGMISSKIQSGVSPTPAVSANTAKLNAEFANRYNAANAKTKDFQPVTGETITIARTLTNPEATQAAVGQIQQAVQTHNDAWADTPQDSAIRGQARQSAMDASQEIALRSEEAIQAAREIEQTADPARRTMLTGLAKVSAGNEAALTPNERKAIQGKQTAGGADYFQQAPTATGGVAEFLTPEARQELATEAPAIARLASWRPVPEIQSPQTAQADVTQQSPPQQPQGPNPADVQGQVGPEAPQAQPGATGVGTEVPASGGATLAGAGEPGGVRQNAVPQGQLTGTLQPSEIPGASPAAQPAQGQTAPEQGQTADPFEPTAEDAASLEKRMQAEAVAEEVVSRVEKSIPGIKGRIQIAEEGGEMPSGGAYADPSGRIVLPLPDIEAELDRNGGDANALADVLERYVSAHEVVHLIQYSSVESAWKEAGSKGTLNQFFKEWYERMHAELGQGVMAAAGRIYGQESWNQISDAAKAAEVVRMLVESRINPDAADVSELFREIRQAKSPTLIETIKRAITMLKELLAKGELPASVQDHVAQIEALYRELTQQSPAQAAEPTGTATEGTASAEGNGGGAPISAITTTAENQNQTPQPTWPQKEKAREEKAKAPKAAETTQAAGEKSPVARTPESVEISTPGNGNIEQSIWKPNHVVFEAISYPDYQPLGIVQVEHDGTPEGIARARMEAERLANQELGDVSHSISRAVATNDQGKPDSYVEVNGKVIKLGTAEAKYAAGDLNAFRDDALQKILTALDQGDVETANALIDKQVGELESKIQKSLNSAKRDRAEIAADEAKFKNGISIKEVDSRYFRGNEKQGQREYLANSRRILQYIEDNIASMREEISKWESLRVRNAKEAKPKRTRQIDSPARREAFRLLNAPDTQLTAINKILGNVGNIQAPPIGMLRLIKNQSKARNLTEKQMAMLRRWRDFSAYMPKASFGTTASGKVAQELHGMLFTTGESNAKLDDWAKALEETNNGPVTNDEALIAVMSELDRVAKGSSTGNPMDIENPTPEDIARAEAEQRAGMDQAEIEQQQAENFDAANTADNGGKPISMEDFTLDMVGKTVTVDGEAMRVVDVEWNGFLEQAESVTLEDGIRFGRQVLEDGEVVYVETSDAPPAESPSPASTSARSTEKPAKASAPDEGKPSAFTAAPFSKEFGAASQIAKKADTAAKVLDRMKPEHRKDFVAAMDAEADRLRNGIISAEAWQRQNPEALSARAAVFQRFIDSHTPESFPDGLEKLLSPEVVARLGSSPSQTTDQAFYSQLARVIEQKMPKTATPAQVVQIAASGAKAEEIKWSGLIPWLQGREKVSKDEVLEYLRNEGSVRFEEVVAAGPDRNRRIKAQEDLRQYLRKEKGYNAAEADTIIRGIEIGENFYRGQDMEIVSRIADVIGMESSDGTPTKFSQYTLPGGENYREVVLAMPIQERMSFNAWVRSQGGNPPDFDENDVESPMVQKWIAAMKKSGGDTYTSSHFPDVPNYVAHMRTNERTDADGKPGLFVEEFQSDRHQAGRKKGYREDFKPTSFTVQSPSGSTYGIFETEEEAKQWISERTNPDVKNWKIVPTIPPSADNAVADAPFRTTWPLALFKRALRDAVASGKDWIGWTVGDTQNDRFDLSKQVDEIMWIRDDPQKGVSGGSPTGTLKAKKDGRIVISEITTPEKLADYIGKDVAERLVNSPVEKQNSNGHNVRRLSGVQLQVGGSGMKGFYDNMLPKEIGKYVKQWGGKVEKSELPLGKGMPLDSIMTKLMGTNWGDSNQEQKDHANAMRRGERGVPIWRIDITGSMRKGVETQGQALFSSPTRRDTGTGDLFAAASAPDAKDKLGDVKVGRVHALNAYRALTAKKAKVGLSPAEEQQLLDVEQALGQKLAFDMDGVKGEAPATVAKMETVQPPPKAMDKAKGGQSEMMLGGETLKGGQMTLFSSVTPEQDRKYLAAVKAGDMKTAQRMVDEAARAAGYTIGPVYHGTDQPSFDVFDGDVIHFGTLQAAREIMDKKGGVEIEYSIDDPDSDGEVWAWSDRSSDGIGPFKSKEEAAAAIAKLPTEIKPYRVFLKIENPANDVDAGGTGAWRKAKGRLTAAKGHDGIIYQNEVEDPGSTSYAVFDASQIKLADPVTYDQNGNVIPLSQRFNPASDSILYSSPSGEKRVDPLLAAIKKLITEPEKKAETFARMNNLVNGVRKRFDNARLKKEFSKQGVDAARYTQIRDVAILEAVAKALPPEIRGKLIGSFRRLDELKTERGREAYILKLLPKIEQAMEQHLRKLYRKDIRKWVDKTWPQKNDSRNLRGKIGGVSHAIAKEAIRAMTITQDPKKAVQSIREILAPEMDADTEFKARATSFLAKISQMGKVSEIKEAYENFADYNDFADAVRDEVIEAMNRAEQQAESNALAYREQIEENESLTLKEMDELEGKAIANELFHDYENASSARLEKALEFLKGVYQSGREEWISELAARKEQRESDIETLRNALGAPDFITEKMLEDARDKASGIVRKTGDSILHWVSSAYQFFDTLKEKTTDPQAITWVDAQQQKLRDARGAYDDALEADRTALEAAMERIFKTRTGWAGKFDLDPILHDLSQRVDDHGVTVLEGVSRDEIPVPINVAEALVRREISGYDYNGKRYEITAQDMPALEEAWEKFQDLPEEVQAKKRRITFDRVNSAGSRNSIGKKSQLEGLKEWLGMRQPDLFEKYEARGWDTTTLEELDRWLKPEVKELGLWMVDHLKSQQRELDQKHRSEFGIGMDLVENYFPALFESEKERESNVTPDGNNVVTRPKGASALKSRVAHRSRPKPMNALSVFLSNRAQIHFFMTHATPLRELMGVFRSTKASNAMRVTLGDSFAKAMVDELKIIETNGQTAAQGVLEAEKLIRKFMSGYALGVLGMKLSTLAINTTAALNTALGVPVGKLLKGLHPEYIKDVRSFFNSPAILRRLHHGTSHEIRIASQGGVGGHPLAAGSRRLAQGSMQGLNWWDTFSNSILGALAYRAKLEEARKAGMSEKEARRQADAEIDRLSTTVMQPNNLLSRSMGEVRLTSNPMGQLLFMFATEQRKNFAIGLYALRKLTTGKGAMSYGMATQQLVTLGLFYSAFGYLIRSAYQAAFKGEDDEPEEFMERFGKRMTDAKQWTFALSTEHLKGVPLVGEMMSRFVALSLNATPIPGENVRVSESSPNLFNKMVASAWKSAEQLGEEQTPEQRAETTISLIQSAANLTPETAIVSQLGNVAKDALGLLTSNGMELSKEEKFRRMKKRLTAFMSDWTKKNGKVGDDLMKREQRNAEIGGFVKSQLETLQPADQKDYFETIQKKMSQDVQEMVSP